MFFSLFSSREGATTYILSCFYAWFSACRSLTFYLTFLHIQVGISDLASHTYWSLLQTIRCIIGTKTLESVVSGCIMSIKSSVKPRNQLASLLPNFLDQQSKSPPCHPPLPLPLSLSLPTHNQCQIQNPHPTSRQSLRP